LTYRFCDIIKSLFVRQEEAEMPKGGKRRAAQAQRSGHVDKYARLAAKSQAELAAFNAQWERDHPEPEGTAMTTESPEDEEVA
jgi:hypothetical protein